MADANPPDSSAPTAADWADPRGSETFSLLGNETRLAILLALWEAADPFAEGTWDPTEGNRIPFSELRDRVGIDDSGQFNYHLGKLEGLFVEKDVEGYNLLPAGNTIVRTLVSIAGFNDVSLEPTGIDIPCSLCGAPTEIMYQHQRLYHVCTNCDGRYALGEKHPSGVLGAWVWVNPASLSQQGPNSIYLTSRTEIYHLFAMRMAGICPWCSGKVETTLHICEAHDPGANGPCPTCGRHAQWSGRFVCTVCKHTSQESVSSISLHHPAVISFYWQHGIELGYPASQNIAIVTDIGEDAHEQLVSSNPPRVCVTHVQDDDEMQLTYNEQMTVVDVTESD